MLMPSTRPFPETALQLAHTLLSRDMLPAFGDDVLDVVSSLLRGVRAGGGSAWSLGVLTGAMLECLEPGVRRAVARSLTPVVDWASILWGRSTVSASQKYAEAL